MTSTPASILNRPTLPPADAALAGLPVEVADSIEACQGLREPWLRLRERCGVQSPNTDPDRFLAVVGALPETRPHVVLLGPPESPRALIVARFSRRRAAHRFGFLAVPGIPVRFLDITYGGLLAIDRNAAQLAATYVAALLAGRTLDAVFANHIPVLSVARQAIINHGTLRHALCLDQPEPHWVIRPDPTDAEFGLGSLSGRTRRTLRREWRKLNEAVGDARVVMFSRTHDVNRIIEGAAQITSATFHDKLGNPFRDVPIWRGPVELEARRGALRAFFLCAQETPIAFFIGSLYGSTLFLDATGYLPQHAAHSPGKHLLLQLIRHCASESIATIDFGFGDAEYKRIYGTESWLEQSVRLYGRTARATLAWMLDAAATRGAAGLRAAATRLGAIRRIKSTWRRRLTRGSSKR